MNIHRKGTRLTPGGRDFATTDAPNLWTDQCPIS